MAANASASCRKASINPASLLATVTVAAPPSLTYVDALRAAKAEDRSVAYIIERILRAHFEREAFRAEAEQTGRGKRR
jgi:hypothetical protein